MSRRFRLAMIFAALLPVIAQAATWNLVGRVRYPNGDPMPGIKVTITSADQTYTQSDVTNVDGVFQLHALTTGEFIIKPEGTSCSGFSPAQYDQIISSNYSHFDFTGACQPAKPVLISPPNGATAVVTNPTLSWSAPGATSIRVLFGPSSPTPPVFDTTAASSYALSGLSQGTTYSWGVEASNDGTNWVASDVWTFTTAAAAVPPGLRFVPITPCRVADTRESEVARWGLVYPFGPSSLTAGETRNIPIPSGRCTQIPASAKGYVLNATVVPLHDQAGQPMPVQRITFWPSGDVANTMNLSSDDGRVVADAVIIGTAIDGSINVYSSDPTDLVVDVNGYFDDQAGSSSYWFYPTTPCRIADTREAAWPQAGLGAPMLPGQGDITTQGTRDFPVATSTCFTDLPAAAAYSLNFTADTPGFLDYLTAWPTTTNGLLDKPYVSTLNSYLQVRNVVANAAIIPAGLNGSLSLFSTDPTEGIIDTNGYFAPQAVGGLSFYPLASCRAVDTTVGDGGVMTANETRTFPIASAGTCGVPADAKALVATFTVTPTTGFLDFLTAWPSSDAVKPWVSTLNSYLGKEVSNTAIVPFGTDGSIKVFVTDTTHLKVDLTGYFK